MDIIFILLISALVFFVVQFISKKIKLAAPILYLAIGILFGGSLNILYIIGNTDILPNLPLYNSIAMLMMFFAAGFSVDVNSIKKSGKTTVKLFSIPAYVDTLITTLVIFIILQIASSLGFKLSIFECIIISGMLAVASPANIVPACVNYITTGYTGKNNIPGTMIAVSVVDGFITLPLVIVALVAAVGVKSGMDLSVATLAMIAVGCIVGFVLIVGLGILMGRILEMIVRPLLVKLSNDKANNKLAFIALAVTFAITAVIIIGLGKIKGIGMIFSTFGVLIATAIGATIKHVDKTGTGQIVSMKGNILFGIFGMPIIFMYVGSLIDIKVLFNPVMLIVGIVIAVASFSVKGFVTKQILKDEMYTDGERKFAASCFIPKGVTLINFSLILMPLMQSFELGYVIEFMIMLAAISILITMTIGVTQINNAGDKWLFKD